MKDLQELTVSDVLTAYDGRPGCMCGCRGRYYVTAESRAAAEAERGYPLHDEDVRPDEVVRVLRLVQSAGDSARGEGSYYYAELGGRALCVYLTAGASS